MEKHSSGQAEVAMQATSLPRFSVGVEQAVCAASERANGPGSGSLQLPAEVAPRPPSSSSSSSSSSSHLSLYSIASLPSVGVTGVPSSAHSHNHTLPLTIFSGGVSLPASVSVAAGVSLPPIVAMSTSPLPPSRHTSAPNSLPPSLPTSPPTAIITTATPPSTSALFSVATTTTPSVNSAAPVALPTSATPFLASILASIPFSGDGMLPTGTPLSYTPASLPPFIGAATSAALSATANAKQPPASSFPAPPPLPVISPMGLLPASVASLLPLPSSFAAVLDSLDSLADKDPLSAEIQISALPFITAPPPILSSPDLSLGSAPPPSTVVSSDLPPAVSSTTPPPPAISSELPPVLGSAPPPPSGSAPPPPPAASLDLPPAVSLAPPSPPAIPSQLHHSLSEAASPPGPPAAAFSSSSSSQLLLLPVSVTGHAPSPMVGHAPSPMVGHAPSSLVDHASSPLAKLPLQVPPATQMQAAVQGHAPFLTINHVYSLADEEGEAFTTAMELGHAPSLQDHTPSPVMEQGHTSYLTIKQDHTPTVITEQDHTPSPPVAQPVLSCPPAELTSVATPLPPNPLGPLVQALSAREGPVHGPVPGLGVGVAGCGSVLEGAGQLEQLLQLPTLRQDATPTPPPPSGSEVRSWTAAQARVEVPQAPPTLLLETPHLDNLEPLQTMSTPLPQGSLQQVLAASLAPGSLACDTLPQAQPVETSGSGAMDVVAPEDRPAAAAAPEVRRRSPSLQANEEMLPEEELEEEEEENGERAMDTMPPPQALPPSAPPPSSLQPPVAPSPPPSSSSALPSGSGGEPSSAHSGSASPYPDDESFASFVAREIHETASGSEDHFSLSPSPSPFRDPSGLPMDIQTLLSLGPSSSPAPTVTGFGVTANCPATPVQLPEGALSVPLDMTTRNFPKRSKYAHRAAISAMHPYNRTRGGGASVAKTLELLKAVLQSSFDLEVKQLCDDYLHIFRLAGNNIRENTGDDVPLPTLKMLVCSMMEEAKTGYRNSKWEFPSSKLPRNDKVVEARGSPMSVKKVRQAPKTEKGETRYNQKKRKAPTERTADKTTGWKWGMDKRRVDPEKWEPDKLSTAINFVLGVNVNKALGHAANRGKVYYLHPELFKYACDGDDKTWLYENKYLPVHGGKAFLMIYEEVQLLVRMDECYRDSPEILDAVRKLQRFCVPTFMVGKMKNFMQSVQGYFAAEAEAATEAELKDSQT